MIKYTPKCDPVQGSEGAPLQGALSKIAAATGFQPKQCNGFYMGRCPAHNDTNPSLQITEGRDGTVLLRCFAGCTFNEICAASDIKTRDLFSKPARGKSRG